MRLSPRPRPGSRQHWQRAAPVELDSPGAAAGNRNPAAAEDRRPALGAPDKPGERPPDPSAWPPGRPLARLEARHPPRRLRKARHRPLAAMRPEDRPGPSPAPGSVRPLALGRRFRPREIPLAAMRPEDRPGPSPAPGSVRPLALGRRFRPREIPVAGLHSPGEDSMAALPKGVGFRDLLRRSPSRRRGPPLPPRAAQRRRLDIPRRARPAALGLPPRALSGRPALPAVEAPWGRPAPGLRGVVPPLPRRRMKAHPAPGVSVRLPVGSRSRSPTAPLRERAAETRPAGRRRPRQERPARL